MVDHRSYTHNLSGCEIKARKTAPVVCITAMINHTFMSLSAVSYIHLRLKAVFWGTPRKQFWGTHPAPKASAGDFAQIYFLLVHLDLPLYMWVCAGKFATE